jgi:hypothetical protein
MPDDVAATAPGGTDLTQGGGDGVAVAGKRGRGEAEGGAVTEQEQKPKKASRWGSRKKAVAAAPAGGASMGAAVLSVGVETAEIVRLVGEWVAAGGGAAGSAALAIQADLEKRGVYIDSAGTSWRAADGRAGPISGGGGGTGQGAADSSSPTPTGVPPSRPAPAIPTAARGAGVCYDWQKGLCTRGDICRFVHDSSGFAPAAPIEEEQDEGVIVQTLAVPAGKMGGVIGKQGAVIREFEKQAGVIINRNTKRGESEVSITGPKDNVEHADRLLRAHMATLTDMSGGGGGGGAASPGSGAVAPGGGADGPRAGICFDWQKGSCTRGANCRFAHDGAGAWTPYLHDPTRAAAAAAAAATIPHFCDPIISTRTRM